MCNYERQNIYSMPNNLQLNVKEVACAVTLMRIASYS